MILEISLALAFFEPYTMRRVVVATVTDPLLVAGERFEVGVDMMAA